jgi:hypothetical protein
MAVTARRNKKVIVRKIWEIVIWLNSRKEYGSIKKNDAKEHKLLPIRISSRKSLHPVGSGEAMGFYVVEGEKGVKAAEYTSPGVEGKRLKQQFHYLIITQLHRLMGVGVGRR